MIDYSKLTAIADSAFDGKKFDKKPSKVSDAKGKPAPKGKPHISDAKGKPAPKGKPHVSKEMISDALKKVQDARAYKTFKVTDSYRNALKKVKDALEETETTDDAINVAIEALNEVPAEQAIAAVIEVLSEAIDILETNGCVDGTCDGVDETAEPMAEEPMAEEPVEEEVEEEKVEDSAPSDAEIEALLKALNADGANVTKDQLKKAYVAFKKDAKVEDSVEVTVTNNSGETVTVNADGGDTAVGADTMAEPMGAPMGEEPMGPEAPMGEEPAGIEGEEPMPSELPGLEGEEGAEGEEPAEENVEA